MYSVMNHATAMQRATSRVQRVMSPMAMRVCCHVVRGRSMRYGAAMESVCTIAICARISRLRLSRRYTSFSSSCSRVEAV